MHMVEILHFWYIINVYILPFIMEVDFFLNQSILSEVMKSGIEKLAFKVGVYK